MTRLQHLLGRYTFIDEAIAIRKDARSCNDFEAWRVLWSLYKLGGNVDIGSTFTSSTYVEREKEDTRGGGGQDLGICDGVTAYGDVVDGGAGGLLQQQWRGVDVGGDGLTTQVHGVGDVLYDVVLQLW